VLFIESVPELHVYNAAGIMMSEKLGGKELYMILERIQKELGNISSKLNRIIEMDEKILQHFPEIKEVREEGAPELGGALDVMTLLSLPDHLRKTAMVICRMNAGATADDVAKETGKARAVESSYLNQLVTMGHLKKKRKGRKVHFYLEK